MIAPLRQIARETADDVLNDYFAKGGSYPPHGYNNTIRKIEAACREAVTQALTDLKKDIKHTRECDRWNNHSDGGADFRDSPYVCQCFGKQIDAALTHWTTPEKP